METKNNNQSSISLNWLWGSILIVLGGVALLSQFVPWFGELLWAAVFVGAGAVFFTVYIRDRQHWWALIPGYALAMVGVLIMLARINFPGEFIGSFVMFAIAFPFIYVYMNNRDNWWALIPAYATSAVGVLIAISGFAPEFLIAPYVMFAIAFPFFYVYVRNREHWWALIPAGVMSVIGAGLLMSSVEYVIPIALIILGIYLLGRQASAGKPAIPPTTGPDADKPPSV
ncbi:MAG: hypothetical protein JXB30_13665 [Anaerolineae bacterium]|nr:hypothetical protein [Anaerolineae bacterium]